MDAGVTCSHCGLLVGRFGQRREVGGRVHEFCCYGCCLAYQVLHGAPEEPESAAHLIHLGAGSLLAMNIMLFSLLLYADAFAGDDTGLAERVPWLLWALATPLVLVLGGPFFSGTWRAARQGRLTADSLVSLGTLAAYGYSAWQVLEGSGRVFFDTATMVLVLFTLGRYLEAQGRVRALRSLAPMLAAERADVRVLTGAGERLSSVEEVRPGDRVRVAPGARVPVEGRVLEGHSECDESNLSGQPEPRPKAPGDPVAAGSLNGYGELVVLARTSGLDSRWVRLSRQVQAALAEKSLTGETVDRVAAVFIPWVVLLAAATAVFWASRVGLDAALLAGLAVLVVACPCSLGLAAPIAFSLGIGRAAQRGILVRGGGVLERLARVEGIAFDKTGTLTLGHPRVTAFRTDGAPAGEVLARAAGLARGSDHPVARAVADLARSAAVAPPTVRGLEVRAGAGLTGEIDGQAIAMGSAAYMAALGWTLPATLDWTVPASNSDGDSQVFVGWAGRVRGRLDLSDPPRPEAQATIAWLYGRGIDIRLLSGDGTAAVARLAGELGIVDWCAELTPEAKVALLRNWSARRGTFAMVGDGLNDAPVLAAASVGIAVGGASDLACESADVTLPEGGLASLPWLLQLAGDVRRSVHVNLAWAFAYNAVALALAATGLLQPVLAAALMAGSSLLVVLRTLRAARTAAARDAERALPAAVAAGKHSTLQA